MSEIVNTNIRSTYVIMTPELAQKYLDSMLENRALSDNWVTALSNVIKRGEWILDGNSIKMDEGGHLIDGQHRLHAVIRANTPVTMEVKSGFPHDAINIIDTMVKTRNTSDILSMHGIRNHATVASAILVYFMEIKGAEICGSAKRRIATSATVLNEYYSNVTFWDDIATFASTLCNGKGGKLKLIQPSYVGGLSAYLIHEKKKDEKIVKRFFTELMTANKSDNIAIETLRLKLITNMNSQRKYPTKVLRNILVKGWNAYYTGKTVKILKYSSEEGRVELI